MQQVEARGRALNEGNPWTPPPGTVPKRRDRLRARLGFWKAIGTDSFTLSWIAYGKALSFAQPPDHLIFPNHLSARQAADFVAETTRAGLRFLRQGTPLVRQGGQPGNGRMERQETPPLPRHSLP